MSLELRPVGGGSAAALVDAASALARPKTATPETKLVLGVRPQVQEGNGCGAAALAMALTHCLGRTVTQSEVDAKIRLADIFTSASDIRDYARDRGVDARLVNNLTDDEVIDNLAKGRPILFLTDRTPRNSLDVGSMHWRVIDGYEWAGNTLRLHIADPCGTSYWVSWDDLQAEWAKLDAVGLQTGYNRFGVILGKDTADRVHAPDRLQGVFATEWLVDGCSDVVNDVVEVSHGKVWRVLTAIASAVRVLLSLLLYPVQRLLGGLDNSDGKEAVPPGQGLLPDVPSSRAAVAREAAEPTRPAPGVSWWDAGAARLRDGMALTREAPASTLQRGLKPPPAGPAGRLGPRP